MQKSNCYNGINIFREKTNLNFILSILRKLSPKITLFSVIFFLKFFLRCFPEISDNVNINVNNVNINV